MSREREIRPRSVIDCGREASAARSASVKPKTYQRSVHTAVT
jgi:hypothetical protein